MTTVIGGRLVSSGPDGSWYVDVVRPADRPGLAALFAACSPESMRLRFLAPLPEPPRGYLDGALAGRPDEHDALVVRHPGGIAGLASLVTGPGAPPGTGELGVVVADRWQRRGLGGALTAALLARARDRDVRRVSATTAPGRTRLLAALSRELTPAEWSWDPEGVTCVYSLA